MGLIINLLGKMIKDMKSKCDQPEEMSHSIFEEFGIIKPYTPLCGSQFNNFISFLSENRSELLNDNECKALTTLWYVACPDIDGFGNNIWNLKCGRYEIYNKDGVIVRFEKKKEEVESEYYSEGRACFVYMSPDGKFILYQDDMNKKAYYLFVSKDISDRLLKAIIHASSRALEIKPQSIQQAKNMLGIPVRFQSQIQVSGDYDNSSNSTITTTGETTIVSTDRLTKSGGIEVNE